jgi:hypothetical protein
MALFVPAYSPVPEEFDRFLMEPQWGIPAAKGCDAHCAILAQLLRTRRQASLYHVDVLITLVLSLGGILATHIVRVSGT